MDRREWEEQMCQKQTAWICEFFKANNYYDIYKTQLYREGTCVPSA